MRQQLVALLLFSFAFIFISNLQAQSGIQEVLNRGEIRGNFQVEAQYYVEDSITGAQEVPEDLRSNAFLNLIYTNGNFSAGIRYESYLNALLGYPEGYNNNNGIAYRFASFTQDKLSVTVGNFYEQFGTGMVLRTYEERGLGYDNALDGIRVKYELAEGLNLTGIIGKQRIFFELSEGIVRGFDADFDLNSAFEGLKESKTRILLGASAVSKFQPDQDSRFNLPENVATVGGRINITRGKFSVNGDYAFKSNDPSTDNGFIYKNGEALFLQTTYSQKGFGLVLAAKRNDNIDTNLLNDETTKRQGYTSDYFKIGEVYFKDFNATLTKKFSKKTTGRFTYANLVYNQDIIEGKPGKPVVYSNVGIADVTYKFNRKSSIRTEGQFLITEQDQGDWATFLLEYSYAPHWFVAVIDQYNFGNDDNDKQIHYLNGSVG